MLKIYKTYLQYQIDGGCWERFGYSGWLCEEECPLPAKIDRKKVKKTE